MHEESQRAEHCQIARLISYRNPFFRYIDFKNNFISLRMIIDTAKVGQYLLCVWVCVRVLCMCVLTTELNGGDSTIFL